VTGVTRATLLGAALLIVALGAACSFYRNDFPDHACQANRDCFQAQGERCNLDLGLCEIPADAAPVPDARPKPDAAPVPDAGPDAMPVDAAAIDAAPVDAM
jgi:hypothetical protein